MALCRKGQLDQVKEIWETSTVQVRLMARITPRQKLRNGNTRRTHSCPLNMCMLNCHLDKILPHSPPLPLHHHIQAPGKSSLLAGSENPCGTEPAALSCGPCSVLRQSLACGKADRSQSVLELVQSCSTLCSRVHCFWDQSPSKTDINCLYVLLARNVASGSKVLDTHVNSKTSRYKKPESHLTRQGKVF